MKYIMGGMLLFAGVYGYAAQPAVHYSSVCQSNIVNVYQLISCYQNLDVALIKYAQYRLEVLEKTTPHLSVSQALGILQGQVNQAKQYGLDSLTDDQRQDIHFDEKVIKILQDVTTLAIAVTTAEVRTLLGNLALFRRWFDSACPAVKER
jgi:hypothetical protein